MQSYYQMADIGICLTGVREYQYSKNYLNVFQIQQEKYEKLEDKIKIKILETSEDVILEQSFYNNWCRPYGHCKNAVAFSTIGWKKDEIMVWLNSNIYYELGYNTNQLFSILGLHSMFLYRDAIVLHASYIIDNDEAILFTAPSQTGKSTQAELWHIYKNAEIINGDRVLLRKKDEKWMAYGVSICGSSDICKNRSAKINAIVVLEQGSKNKVYPMTMVEKYRAILLGTQYYQWSQDETEKVHEIVINMVKDVKMVKYSCRPDKDAVLTLDKYLESVL